MKLLTRLNQTLAQALTLAPTLVLAACTMPQRSVENFTDLAQDRIVLVGRLSINQKLPESTNVIDTIGITESGLIRASAEPLPFLDSKPESFEESDILVKWGETFSVPYPRLDHIFVSGIYSFQYEKRGVNNFAFPVTGVIKPKGKGRFQYVGHIKLKLDDFYVVQAVQVVDEMGKDPTLKKFPGLQKALFQPGK